MNAFTSEQRQQIHKGDACPHCARRFTVAIATDTDTREIKALIYCAPCNVSRSEEAPFSYVHHINATAA